MVRTRSIILLGVILAFTLHTPVLEARDLHYDTAIVEINGDTGQKKTKLAVRVADNYLKRYIGLRQAESLDTGTGMIFVYESAAPRNFTMRDMSIPLDIIFVAEDRRIRSIHSVRPGRENISSQDDAKWVLEARYGWARRHSIKPGDHIQIRR